MTGEGGGWDEVRTLRRVERRDRLLRLLAAMDAAPAADRKYVDHLAESLRIAPDDVPRLEALEARYVTRRVIRRPAPTATGKVEADVP